jgi:hypothetical protein
MKDELDEKIEAILKQRNRLASKAKDIRSLIAKEVSMEARKYVSTIRKLIEKD